MIHLAVSIILGFLILVQPPLPADEKVVVVGAGLAGLTAAYRLDKMGHSVELYEARGRPGGRVLTVKIGDGYAECGGQNLYDGGDAENILALIVELGLETIEYEIASTHSQYLYQGKPYSYLEAFRTFPKEPTEEIYQSLVEYARGAQNFEEVLDLFSEGDSHFSYISKLRMRNYEGSDSHLLSPLYVDSFWNYFLWGKIELPDQPLIRSIKCVKGGSSALVERLMEPLSQKIHYHAILKRISQEESGKICLHFNQGKRVLADKIILALPCSTLREVDVEEGLFPQDQ